MKFTPQSFRAWKHKSVTLLGMSGVGKTHLAMRLRRDNWFHYSGDYRIGTRYLDEAIIDLVKRQAMQVPFLRDLLRRDWIHIDNNIEVDDLGPVLSFVGKLGDPERGGVPLADFVQRQALYRDAEIAAMRDVANYINKAHHIYGYENFVNDVGGSLCDIEAPEVIELLARDTLILYLRATNGDEEQTLVQRTHSDPKPLYFRPAFLEEQLACYLEQHGMRFAAEMDPDDFMRWVFPRLYAERVPRYEAIAAPHGYSVTAREAAAVRDERDFIDLVATAIARQNAIVP